MHLVYIDEVKYEIPNQPYYWLCGFAVDQHALSAIDTAANSASKWYFEKTSLGVETEFHAKHIVHGTGLYKGHGVNRRIELFFKLIDCLCCNEAIKRIEVRIDPSKITHNKDPAEAAFMFFSEKCDELMKSMGSIGILIADDDSKKVRSKNVSSLCNYREWATDWHFGRKIEHLVDTVHHTQSHHSRMIQLADIFVYSCQLQDRENLNYVKQQIYDYAKEAGLYNPAKYKYWPTDDSPWYQAFQPDQ